MDVSHPFHLPGLPCPNPAQPEQRWRGAGRPVTWPPGETAGQSECHPSVILMGPRGPAAGSLGDMPCSGPVTSRSWRAAQKPGASSFRAGRSC